MIRLVLTLYLVNFTFIFQNEIFESFTQNYLICFNLAPDTNIFEEEIILVSKNTK